MLRRGIPSRVLVLVGLEGVAILLVIAVAAKVRLGADAPSLFVDRVFLAQAVLVAVVCQSCLYLVDMYDFRVTAESRELLVRAPQALGVTSLVLAAIYFWLPSLIIGRGVFVLAATGVVGLVLGWRYAFERFGSAVIPKERLLIVGTEPGAVALARELHERKEVGMQVVGFIDNGAERTRESFTDSGAAAGAIAGIPVVGTTNDISAVVENYDVDRIVVSLIDARGKLPVESLLDLRLQGIHFDHLASVYEEHTGKIPVENLRPSWLIFSDGFRKSSKLLFAKRAVDVVAGAVGLVVLSPLMALVAAGG